MNVLTFFSKRKMSATMLALAGKIRALVLVVAMGAPVAALTIPSLVRGSATGEATTLLENTVSQVLNILKDHQTPQNERRRKLIEVVAPRFDFTDMARSSLGYHWRQLNTAQQEQFIQLFTAFMEDAYLNKLEAYSDQKIEFSDERAIGSDDREVSTRVVSPGRAEEATKVDYQLQRHGDQWKVYDVMVDGISITANYRNQFNRLINNQGFDALMNEMRNKQRELIASLAK
jgi:phospholipid transport system substrate-binding protein